MTGTNEDPLWKVLRRNLPWYQDDFKGEQGKYGLNVTLIAQDMGVTKKTVFEWLSNNKVPGRRVNSLLALHNSTLTINMIQPYIAST